MGESLTPPDHSRRFGLLSALPPCEKLPRASHHFHPRQLADCHARVNLSSCFCKGARREAACRVSAIFQICFGKRKDLLFVDIINAIAMCSEIQKWAANQEAVTFPWLSAHSIRTGIGGDIYIVFPPIRLSRINFHSRNCFNLRQFHGKMPQNAPPRLTLCSPKCYFNWF